MASRAEDLPPLATQGPKAQPSLLHSHSNASSAGGLFRVVRDEPFVQSAAAAIQPSSATEALVLQRCMDVTIAIVCLLLVWPILVLCAVAVRLTSPGPIIYHHQRLGRDGKVFNCLKFRTMRMDADRVLAALLESSPALRTEWIELRKLRQDPRITSIGRFLRRYSLDELPQLFNVLRGDMSIVGPRPLATDEAHYYAESFATYCSVNPGITGLWQVSGRNDVSYSRRVQLDCQYATSRTLRGDVWIIVRTIPVVFGGNGY
ncbi:sugar transferase [Sphingomonas sp. GCM10030256]|uniref:sugar transferase n=1 Tax=Sphingomonas sp. GCM10030256 TaxID=3273427 RepID=UPI003607EE43